MTKRAKNKLSAENLIGCIYDVFTRITDKTTTNKPQIPLVDYLMSGLATFKLKYSSLLQFDKNRLDPVQSHNLKTLFHIKQAPSDTSLRERLDQLSPKLLRKAYTRLFAEAQRHKALEPYAYLNGRYLVSIDGTGYFSSKTIHCENCCVKNHRDGTQTYYHQMLAAVLVHPEKRQVIPFCPEFIQKQDGAKKNDCERNASKRLLKDLKREHPHLKLLVVEDALASNAPHIELLQQLDYQFILGAKPADHTWLFNWIEASQCRYYECRDEQGCMHQFKYLNDVPLNKSNEHIRVNFLDYWEVKPNGKKQHFTWVTDVLISDQNVMKIMRGGRARWKVENETFNTLKTQGYRFEHNFGHGNKHLSEVLALLMMLAFMVDELQFLGCGLMHQAKEIMGSKKRLWFKLRAAFDGYYILNWEDLVRGLAYGFKKSVLFPDTS